ncbi:hypothetical protein SKDZ_04G5200 [Saccharomyces kudriavzevii ZP591]|nr:hypothetical protein SKDZ_04G5200 [Saccharomyces kudriavzevii ZP591]
MSDPFAHLLASLKNKDSATEFKETTSQSTDLPSSSGSVVPDVLKTDKGNYESPHSVSAWQLIPPSKVSFSAAPLVPSNSTSSANTASDTPSPAPANIDDDFDEIFGSDVIAATGGLQQVDQDSHDDDDGDDALVDEVKDMEIARLMSLGLSVEKATEFYNDDITYERYLEILKSKQKKHRDRIAREKSNDIKIKKPGLFNNTDSDNNNLLSIATDFFNKGKELMDQWTSFPPEENNRLKSHLNVEDESNDYDLSLEENPCNSGGDNLDEDLLTDFEAKIDITKRASKNVASSPSPSFDIPIDEDSGKKESSMDDSLLDFSPDNFTKSDSTENNTLFGESSNAASVVPISDIELSGYSEFKAKGATLFKNGDYVNSLQEYEKALNSLPSNHPLRIIGLSNIIASQLKVGEYSKSIVNSDLALALFPPAKASWNTKISNSDPQRSFNDMWPKIMIRRAESFEHLESFKNALETYQELISRNFFDDKIMQGKRRCQNFISPPLVRKSTPVKKTTPTLKKPAPDPSPAPIDIPSKVKEQELENAKLALYDKVFGKIGTWKGGKEDDIRHLLSNLSQLLTWCNWKDVSMQDLVMPKKVKIAYMKAVAKTHPDKIPESLSLENKMIAENIFSTLSIAWDKFKQQNDIN